MSAQLWLRTRTCYHCFSFPRPPLSFKAWKKIINVRYFYAVACTASNYPLYNFRFNFENIINQLIFLILLKIALHFHIPFPFLTGYNQWQMIHGYKINSKILELLYLHCNHLHYIFMQIFFSKHTLASLAISIYYLLYIKWFRDCEWRGYF